MCGVALIFLLRDPARPQVVAAQVITKLFPQFGVFIPVSIYVKAGAALAALRHAIVHKVLQVGVDIIAKRGAQISVLAAVIAVVVHVGIIMAAGPALAVGRPLIRLLEM